MKKLFLAASGLFSAVPGLVVIWKGLATPPNENSLFGGIIEALGAFTFIVLFINRKKIQRLPINRVTKWASVSILLFFIFIVLYIGFFNYCIKSHDTHGTVYYPLWTSGEAAKRIETAGGRWEALDRYGNYPVTNSIRKMPSYALTITTALLIFLYQGIFTSLATAFGVLGFHQKKGFD